MDGLRGIVFDVDGTLIDSNRQHAKAFVDAFKINGYEAGYSTVLSFIGMGSDKLIPAVLNRDVTTAEQNKINSDKKKYFEEKYFKEIVPFPEVFELVTYLKSKGLQVAVATSAGRSDVSKLLRVAGVETLFNEIVCADDAENSKPDPDIIDACRKRLNLSPGHLAMVGDTPYDIQAAITAGLWPIGFTSGGWKREQLAPAEKVFAGPADLLKNIDELNLGSELSGN